MSIDRNAALYGRVINWDDLQREELRPGVRRAAYGTNEVMLVMNELEAGMQLNPHVHDDFDQLAYILEGEADYYIGDEAHRMAPGSILLVPAGKHHHIQPTTARVLNLDIFVPPRADLLHLLEWIGPAPAT
ncbi:MAG: cupin domain-containing protein [Candidatus Dormibacter sp.]